ncbi:hypothetical protein [Hoeflea olei]|uniref:Uncharacterized protein n=1 Tax=Hoeflea olei TaxID=1480615 RepID=A0A1C1YVM3_9HYPH|nr:hypothetical protein [Hoeflea olei]OCW57551.1 hypothetical protein AWJ14_01650 [Hoeflea olei]
MRILSRLMVLGLVAIVAWLAGGGRGAALELERNGTRYEIALPLPKGTKISRSGVDRRFSVNGIGVSMRLIQDSYSECGKLTSERESNGFKRNHTSLPFTAVITPRECSTQLYSPERVTTKTHYVWLDMCQCYAAIHFSYADGERKRFEQVSPPILAALRKPSSAGSKGKAPTGLELDSDWLEAFRIFKKRGFPAALVYNILGDTAHIALGAAGLSDRYAEELARLYGTSVKDVKDGKAASASWFYDLETGFAIGSASPQQIASNLSSCYRNYDYWRACKLNYHQEQGCRLTKAWKTVCGAYMKEGMSQMIGDLCFWEPRGDLPMLAGADTREKSVMLPGGKKVAKAPGKKKKKVKQAAASNVPYCADDGPGGWRDYLTYLRDKGEGVPAGLGL